VTIVAGRAEIGEKSEKELKKEAFSEFMMLQHLEVELKKLGTFDTFPNDGMERYDLLTEHIYSTKEKIVHLKHRISSELELAAQINKKPISELLKKNKDIIYLEKRISSISEHENKLKILDKDIEQKANKLKEEIIKIFPSWTEKADIIESKLGALDFSLPLNEQFHSYRKTISEVDSLLTDTKKKIDYEQQNKNGLEEKIIDIRNQIMDITSNTSVDLMRSDIIKIREDLFHKEELSCEIRSLLRYRKELLLELCETEGFNSSIKELKYMLILQSAFSLSCALIVIGNFIFNTDMVTFTALSLITLSLFSYFSFFIHRRGLSREKDQASVLKMFIEKKERVIDSIVKKVTDLKSQEDEILQNIDDRASKLDIPSIDSTNIEELSEKLEFARLKLRRYADVKEQERQLSELIEKSNEKLIRYKQEINDFNSKIADILSSWKEWLTKNNYPEYIAISEYDSFVSCVKEAQSKLEILNTIKNEAQTERNYIRSTDELVYDFCSSLNIKSEDIFNVFNAIKEAAALKKRLDEVNDNVIRLNSEKKAAEEILEKYTFEMQALFTEANVKSEKEFNELSQTWERHWIINAKMEEKWNNISVICGGRRAAEKFVNENRAGAY
jgi:chromosome segregation ATPase